MALFYRGLACMETGDHSQAIRSFREIPDDWASAFAEHRDWYLALALLKSNHTFEATGMLKKIMAGNGYYVRQAKHILKRLKS